MCSCSCIARTSDSMGRRSTPGFVSMPKEARRTDCSKASPGSIPWTESTPEVALKPESGSCTLDISYNSSWFWPKFSAAALGRQIPLVAPGLIGTQALEKSEILPPWPRRDRGWYGDGRSRISDRRRMPTLGLSLLNGYTPLSKTTSQEIYPTTSNI
jgi:hypothetical protein